MPALQSLVVTDRATTPVNHTLTPRELSQPNSVGMVSESGSGMPLAGQLRLTISNRRSGGKIRGRLVLTAPVTQTETVNGVSKYTVVRQSVADLSVTFDETSTTQERTDLIGMLASALATNKVLVHSTLVDAETVWG